MRFSAGLAAMLAVAAHALAQAICPSTVTVTANLATLNGTATSSDSSQVVYTTAFQTTVVISNGITIAETVPNSVLGSVSRRQAIDIASLNASDACPEAVTVTVMASGIWNQSTPTTNTQPPVDSVSSWSASNDSETFSITNVIPTSPVSESVSSSWLGNNLTTTTAPGLNSTSVFSSLTTATSTSDLASSSTSFNTTLLASNVTHSTSSFDSSSSMTSSLASTSLNNTAVSTALDSTSSSPIPTTLPPASATSTASNEPLSASSSTTQSSENFNTSALSSFGVALDVWSTPTPTLECSFPCQLKMPCMSLPTPTTITFPPYTTSLCKPGCSGSVQMKSMTTIDLPILTADSVCFYPMSADSEGSATPNPRWMTGTRIIDAPKGLSTCPPIHAQPDANGMCGPDNHYMCEAKQCCGKSGKCGTGEGYCDEGCQPNYGDCWKNSTSCKVPVFGHSDETTPIPIFPVIYDQDNDLPLPPIIIRATDLPGPTCKNNCDDPICDILGCDGKCGILSCSGIDMGWFRTKFPDLGCNSPVRKFTCTFLKIGCCNTDGTKFDAGCTIPPCLNNNDDDKGVNGDFQLCDDGGCEPMEKDPEPSESASSTASSASSSRSTSSSSSASSSSSTSSSSSECSSTTTVQDQTAYCTISTATDGKTATSCAFTATGSPRKGCSIHPSTMTSITSGCRTQTASHVTNDCTILTGSGTETRTECTSRATTISGCDVTGITTTSAVTHCSNSNTVTNITSSCYASNTTYMEMTSIGELTCTDAVSTVFSGCDLSGTISSVTSWGEDVCEHIPSDITIISMPAETVPDIPATAHPDTSALSGSTSTEDTGSAQSATPTSASSVAAALSVLGSAVSPTTGTALAGTAAVGSSTSSVAGALSVLGGALTTPTGTATVQARWWNPFGY